MPKRGLKQPFSGLSAAAITSSREMWPPMGPGWGAHLGGRGPKKGPGGRNADLQILMWFKFLGILV